MTSTCKRCGGEIRGHSLTLYLEGAPGDFSTSAFYHPHCWRDKQALDREIEMVRLKGELADANRIIADLQKPK